MKINFTYFNFRKTNRIIKLFLPAFLILCLGFSSFAVDVFIGGKLLIADVEPRIVESRTLVALAAVGGALEAKVAWDEKSRTVTVSRGNDRISLQIGQSLAEVNGSKIKLDVPAQIIEGRTMVPVSFIAQAFNESIAWDDLSKTVFIKSYPVSRVVDGDTLKIVYNEKEVSVRLIGIDTPESVHPDSNKNVPEGRLAADFTRRALEGKEVFLEFDISESDRYGRLLAYVWTEDGMFNKALLKAGMASVYTYPPDVKYAEEFMELEKEARKNKIGLW